MPDACLHTADAPALLMVCICVGEIFCTPQIITTTGLHDVEMTGSLSSVILLLGESTKEPSEGWRVVFQPFAGAAGLVTSERVNETLACADATVSTESYLFSVLSSFCFLV
jgi:hypothetical protein